MLCPSCQKIFTAPEIVMKESTYPRPNYAHSNLVQSIYDARQRGCQICVMLCQHFMADTRNEPAHQLNLKYHIACHNPDYRNPNRFATLVFRYQDKTTLSSPEGFLSMAIYEDEVASKLRSSKALKNSADTLVTSTSSEKSLEQALSWLNACLQNHIDCNRLLSQDDWWPSRLIDVAGSITDSQIRLIETSDSPPSSPYLTLSHCWGNLEFFRLTSQNLEELKAGFSIKVLPQTFQDAIVVAKKLCYQYIWIDSLCIIQDSFDDWTQEASQMSDVYQHAICNIAATKATDSSQGLFADHMNFETQICTVQIPATATKKRRSSIWGTLGAKSKHASKMRTLWLEDESIWTDYVEESPLLRRGWVVQERLLAKRVLHFSNHQIFWECREDCACETYPEKMSYTAMTNAAQMKNFTLAANEWMSIPDDPNRSKEIKWRAILSKYSSAQLSKPDDKEAAFIGIVDYLQKAFGDIYVAGLWTSVILSQLVWLTPLYSTGIRRAHRAPSWSWLSIDGAVLAGVRDAIKDENDRELYAVDLVELSVTRTGKSPISPICTGVLKLRGFLHIVSWKEAESRRVDLEIRGMPRVRTTGYLDYIKTGSLTEKMYYCVVVAVYRRNGVFTSNGLILKHVSKGIYERVGIFHCFDEDILYLISKRRQQIYKGEMEPYEKFPFQVFYSVDRLKTTITREVSAREMEEQEADFEEGFITII